MRHTFEIFHIASGENPTWVYQVKGHSNVKITLDKYNRFVPNLTRDNGSAFELALEKVKKGNIKVILR